MAYIKSNEEETKANQNWFIGCHVPREIKQQLKAEASANHRTVSQQLNFILEQRYFAKQIDKGES